MMAETPDPQATAPAAPIHPLEAWAEPTASGEHLIRRPLEDGGTFITPTTLAKLEAEGAQRRAQPPAVLHQVEIDRQRSEREAAAEAERKARNPVKVLRQAHVL